MQRVTPQAKPSPATWRLAPAWRKGVLVLHVISGIGWYWWVLVKLCLSLIMTLLVFLSLVPGVNELARLDITVVSADAVRASLGDLTTQLMFPPIVSFLMLGTATVLSIYKPWRRTPCSRSA